MNASRICHRAVVGDTQNGCRADRAAADLFGVYSRTRLQAWMRSGELLLDDRTIAPRDTVSRGQVFMLNAEHREETGWQPQCMDLAIVHQDQSIVVIDKPPGLVVHPGAGVADGTLANGLLDAFPELRAVPRAGIVHRLDRDTSGLMVVARTLQAHTCLVSMLREQQVQRYYQAVVRGRITAGGVVDAPIGRHPVLRTRMAVRASGGRAAVTHYRVHERLLGHTHLALKLQTGRTHQIRVHCAHIGHPVVGDRTYGGRAQSPRGLSPAARELLRRFPRQALHAQQLRLLHPSSGEEQIYEAPTPEDFRQLVEVFGVEQEGGA